MLRRILCVQSGLTSALLAGLLTVTANGTANAQSSACAYPNFPNASCTGYQHTGVTLTPYTGPMTITTAGTVIDGKLISGDLNIVANNVTVKRSKVQGGRINTGYSAQSGAVIEDVEIDAGRSVSSCIGESNFTARRVNLHGCGQGVNAYNFTLTDSYIHDLYGENVVHSEAILGYGGGIVVRHNYLSGNYGATGSWSPTDGGMSSSVSFYTHGSWGPMNNVVFEQNRLNVGGGARDYAGFCLYAGGSLMSNGTFRDNVFARHPQNPSRCGYHGTVTDFPTGGGSCWSNNKFEDGTVISGGNQACAASGAPSGPSTPVAPSNLRIISSN